MSKLKVAILEDSKLLLKELKNDLDATGLVDVVVWAVEAEEFIEKVKKSRPEALLLDIDLSGSSMNGLDIANRLQLPVLFVSGKTGEFYGRIEELNLNSKNIVDHITKPITLMKLQKLLPKFIDQIRSSQNAQYAYLNFGESKRNKLAISDIVFLESDKAHGAASNNKRIYFKNRPPETLLDFSFVRMDEKGLTLSQFITCHKSYRVNVSHIERYDKDHHIMVVAVDSAGKSKEYRLPVSENYRKIIKRHFN